MKNDNLFIKEPLRTIDGIGVFSADSYWGKVPESELINCIKIIDEKGFSFFDKTLQKKFDFTYDEDRADWRYFIPLSNTSTVLDIGAGLGRITIPLARIAGQVYSCDQSISRMRFLQRRAQAEGLNNVKSFIGDVFDLPLEKNSFDLIVMNGVLEWVGLTDLYKDPKEAQRKSLSICLELLKPGGYLYIGIENRTAIAYLKAADHGGLLYTGFMPRKIADIYSKIRGKKGYRTYTYTKKGYEKLIEESGFEKPDFYLLYPGYNLPRIILNYNDIHLLKFLLNSFKSSNNLIRRVLYRLVSIDIIARIYRLFFYSFGIIARKKL